MPKQIGDVVRYTSVGRTVNALVIGSRDGTPSHLGPGGEQILNLAFIDPARESAISKNQIGWVPRVFIEFDVVHATHEFSEVFKLAQGLDTPAKIAAIRGHGEWSEFEAERKPEAKGEAKPRVVKGSKAE